MQILSYRDTKHGDLCDFSSIDGNLDRKFMGVDYTGAVVFLTSYGTTRRIGRINADVDSKGAHTMLTYDRKDCARTVSLLSKKQVDMLKDAVYVHSTRQKNAFAAVAEEIGVIKQLDYIAATTKATSNGEKIHYVEFKQVEPTLDAKPLSPRTISDYYDDGETKNERYFAPLSPTKIRGLTVFDSTYDGVVVYPLFKRFASSQGFVRRTECGAGYVVTYVGGYLPCICVRVKGGPEKVYEISLDRGYNAEVEVLATTKFVEKVEKIIRAKVSAATLGIGNASLVNILRSNKYYRCVRRRYTNEEFVKDVRAERAKHAAKFADVWEMKNALDLHTLDHEVCVSLWETANSIINK